MPAQFLMIALCLAAVLGCSRDYSEERAIVRAKVEMVESQVERRATQAAQGDVKLARQKRLEIELESLCTRQDYLDELEIRFIEKWAPGVEHDPQNHIDHAIAQRRAALDARNRKVRQEVSALERSRSELTAELLRLRADYDDQVRRVNSLSEYLIEKEAEVRKWVDILNVEYEDLREKERDLSHLVGADEEDQRQRMRAIRDNMLENLERAQTLVDSSSNRYDHDIDAINWVNAKHKEQARVRCNHSLDLLAGKSSYRTWLSKMKSKLKHPARLRLHGLDD